MAREPQNGNISTLHSPYLGYRRIELIEHYRGRWLARICESGLEISVYEDEFIIDDLQYGF